MEINLSDIVWPVSVLRCHEALKQLQPGGVHSIRDATPVWSKNILLLIKSQPELCFKQCHESEVYHIIVDRMNNNQDAGAGHIPKAAHERS